MDRVRGFIVFTERTNAFTLAPSSPIPEDSVEGLAHLLHVVVVVVLVVAGGGGATWWWSSWSPNNMKSSPWTTALAPVAVSRKSAR
eukprot:5222854-Amphidinium_carterae.1